MKFALAAVLLTLAAALGGIALRLHLEPATAPATQAPADPYLSRFQEVTIQPEATGPRYDAVTTLTNLQPTSAPEGKPAHARLFFDLMDDQNYHAIDLIPSSGPVDGGQPGVAGAVDLVVSSCEAGIWREVKRARVTSMPKDRPLPLRLQRRHELLTVLLGGRRVLSASMPYVASGRLSAAAAGGAIVTPPVAQPVGPILFADDFMRGPNDPGAWEAVGPCAWSVRSLDNPARSSNAFVFEGTGRGMALTGHAFWSDYVVEAAVLAPPHGTFGLVASAAGETGVPENVLVLRWNRAPTTSEGAASDAAPDTMDKAKAQGDATDAAPEGDAKTVDAPDGRTTDAAGSPASARSRPAPCVNRLQLVLQRHIAPDTPAKTAPSAAAEDASRSQPIGAASAGGMGGGDDPTAAVSPPAFEEILLAEREGAYRAGQWYRVGLRVSHGEVIAVVDGHDVLRVASPWAAAGRAGLYVDSADAVEFDDVRLRSERGFTPRDPNRIPWRTLSGDEPTLAEIDRVSRSVSEATSAPHASPASHAASRADGAAATDPLAAMGLRPRGLALTGESTWDHLRVAATIDPDRLRQPVGLIAAARGPRDFVAYVVDPKAGREYLARYAAGAPEVLAEGPWTPSADLALATDRGHLQGGALHAFVSGLAPGRVGLWSVTPNVPAGPDGPRAATPAVGERAPWPPASGILSFAATPIAAPPTVISINEVFDDEQLMKQWSGAQGDWVEEKASGGAYDQIFWHRARFAGDVEIEAPIPDAAPARPGVARAPSQGTNAAKSLALSFAKTHGSSKANNGYVALWRQAAGAHELALIREGETVAEATLEEAPMRLRLRKAGPRILLYVDDRPVLAYDDPEPLAGDEAAWAAAGLSLDPGAVQIYHRRVRDYSFNSAPADWRQAGGVWQVQNRWECDPRWSFMAGMPPYLARSRADRFARSITDDSAWTIASLKRQIARLPEDADDKLAALWHKERFEGDVVVEAFIGPMMDEERNRREKRYGFIKNFCISLATDGDDLDSGYTFIFGADDNERSVIKRKGVVVRSVPIGIPKRHNIHRNWFRLRVERRGGTLRFSVHTQNQSGRREETLIDGARLLYRDEEPLPADRVAIWGYDCGLVVARLRVSASQTGALEDPFAVYRPVSRHGIGVEPGEDPDKVRDGDRDDERDAGRERKGD